MTFKKCKYIPVGRIVNICLHCLTENTASPAKKARTAAKNAPAGAFFAQV